jgi:hypothetical protein
MSPRGIPDIVSIYASPPSPTMSEVQSLLPHDSCLKASSPNNFRSDGYLQEKDISLSEIAFAMEFIDLKQDKRNPEIKRGHFIPKNLGRSNSILKNNDRSR